MKPGKVLIVAALLMVVPLLCVFGASVPVFQHDPVQEKHYFQEHILPRLIGLAVILCLAVAACLAIRKHQRKA